VTSRPGEAAVDRRDATILESVADQAAPAMAALQLSQELQRSRESLVAAREEERLRLRRELHDGLGATLAGVRLQVESAQALVKDPTAERLLVAAGGGVGHAVAEVRAITDELRPPAIDDLGLVRALALLADRVSTPGLSVQCDLEALERLAHVSPATEVAVYRIASEALTNATRHSGGSTVHLRMATNADQLVLVVTDDGVGCPPASDRPAGPSSNGLGLASMRQRAEEIGGSFEVGSRPDGRGTQVTAVLPSARGTA
jgi:two-component system NarL family sensor kinase